LKGFGPFDTMDVLSEEKKSEDEEE